MGEESRQIFKKNKKNKVKQKVLDFVPKKKKLNQNTLRI